MRGVVETELLLDIDEESPTAPAEEDTGEVIEDILMLEALDATLGALLETASDGELDATEERTEAMDENPTTDDDPVLKADETGWLAEGIVETPEETG